MKSASDSNRKLQQARILVAVFMSCGYFVNSARASQAMVTYADLRSGYWLNYEEFKTLFVSWHHVKKTLENARSRIKDSLKSRDQEYQDAILASYRDRIEQNQFWTNRIEFQVRTPCVLTPNREQLRRSFPFPKVIPRKDNLVSDFSETAIYDYTGKIANGIKFWNGVSDGRPQGAILSLVGEAMPARFLPPLAYPHPVAGFVPHPIDTFFMEEYEEVRVVDRVERDGRDVYVVEKVVRRPDERMQLKHFVERTGGDFDAFSVQAFQKAWIDTERGYLPIRLETTQQWVYKGVTVRDPWGLGPLSVLETHEIAKVADGGFYPTNVSQVEYALDSMLDTAELSSSISFVKVIDGTLTKRRSVADSEQQWIAKTVDASFDMNGVFSFEFPDSMAYMDFRDSIIKGKSYETPNGPAAHGTKGGSPKLDTTRWALIAANVLLVIVIAGILLVRRLRTA